MPFRLLKIGQKNGENNRFKRGSEDTYYQQSIQAQTRDSCRLTIRLVKKSYKIFYNDKIREKPIK